MEVSVEHIGDVTVARPCVEYITARNAGEFKSALSGVFSSDMSMVLDLSPLEFIDSAGIGALMSCMNRLRSLNGTLKLCSASRSVLNILELVRIDRLVEIYGTLDEAVLSFGAPKGMHQEGVIHGT
jgi:anti-sigma B factor antagonist